MFIGMFVWDDYSVRAIPFTEKDRKGAFRHAYACAKDAIAMCGYESRIMSVSIFDTETGMTEDTEIPDIL